MHRDESQQKERDGIHMATMFGLLAASLAVWGLVFYGAWLLLA